MKIHFKLTNHGFTLIEILIASTIMAFIGIFVVSAVLSVIRSSLKAELMKEIKQNGDYALDFITRTVQFADTVQCNGAGSQLTVDGYQQGTTTRTVITPVTSSDVCRLQYSKTTTAPDGSGTTDSSQFLTSDLITLNFSGTCPDNGITFVCGTQKNVGVSFVLRQKGTSTNPAETAKMQFKSTVNVRNK